MPTIRSDLPRHRSQLSPTTILTKQVRVYNGTTWDVMDSQITPPRATAKVTDDWVNRPFKQRVANGEVFLNPFSKLETRFVQNGSCFEEWITKPTTGLASTTKSIDHTRLTSMYLAGSLGKGNLTVDTSEEELRAQINCIGSVNKTEFDVGTFAAEWHKTKLLHRDVGNALLKVFLNTPRTRKRRTYRKKVPLLDNRGNPLFTKKGKQRYRYYLEVKEEITGSLGQTKAQDLANAWLVGRYGVRPLLADLENASKFLSASKALRRTARGNLTKQATRNGNILVPTGESGYNITTTHTLTKIVRYGILYESTTAATVIGQLGLNRPLSTAWELVPYSFVLDWFLGVGNWLDAIQPSLASKTLSAWVSRQEISVFSAGVSANIVDDRNTYGRFEGSWSEGIAVYESYKTRDSWLPQVPSRPAYGSGFNSMRCGDFAALVLQKIYKS